MRPTKEQFYLTKRYIRRALAMLRTEGLFSPHKTWVCTRYYWEWLRTQSKNTNAFSEGVPWITFEARDFLKRILKPEWSVFEYGSGGSTIFLSKRARQVVSVEHDAGWFSRVAEALRQHRITNCQLLLVPPEVSETDGEEDPANPANYRSGWREYEGCRFFRYAASIDSMPDHSLDLVIVDGRARPSCIHHAYPKVKVGGWLLLDDSERQHYQRVKEILAGWEPQVFFGPAPYSQYFWETTIWRRLE